MFSSALDTVLKTDEKQLLKVEAFLMHSALSGDPAVLSPNQAIDSSAIQAIVLGNAKQEKNYFLEAVRLGIVHLSIPSGFSSLTDYCIGTLKRGEEHAENAFLFSSLPFLYREDVTAEGRAEVMQYIGTQLREARLRTRSAVAPAWLSSDEKETLERYVNAVIHLDRATEYYDTYVSNKALFPLLLERDLSQRLLREPPDSALARLITLILAECRKPERAIYRSYYYNVCNRREPEFGAEAVREVKALIDACYNRLASLSLGTGAALNIEKDLSEVAALQADNDRTKCSTVTGVKISETDLSCLDWYSIVEIYREVDALCREKGISWQDALESYYRLQSRLPFILGGKTLLITSVTMAISALPLVGMVLSNPVSDFIWNIVTDEFGNTLHKPSAREILQQTQQAKHNQRILDIVVFSGTGTGG